jgi:hypothetical protein
MIYVIPGMTEIAIIEEHAWLGRVSSMKSILEQRVLQALRSRLEGLKSAGSYEECEADNTIRISAFDAPERPVTVTLTELGDYVMAVCAIPREPAFFTLIRDDHAIESDVDSFVARIKIALQTQSREDSASRNSRTRSAA